MTNIATALEAVRAAVDGAGYAVVDGLRDIGGHRALGAGLGRVLREDAIVLDPSSSTNVAQPAPIPLHNDHPGVHIISWFCVEQDAADGTSVLFDARPLLEQLSSAEWSELSQTRFMCPTIKGGLPRYACPMLARSPRGPEFFFAPWLAPVHDNAVSRAALQRFAARLRQAAPAAVVEIRLAPGQALFVDNRRLLHGRRDIATNSSRNLHRLWMRRREPAGRGA